MYWEVFRFLYSLCFFTSSFNMFIYGTTKSACTQSAMEGLEVLCSSEGKFNFFRHTISLERPESILNGFKVLFSSAL